MSNRNRMTWNAGDRRASAPPATPGYLETQEHGHPADQPDPGPHDYENGDTSSWNEDPRPGPYVNSAAPALPTEAGGHPAAKKAALVARLERKASKCIRIAQAMLGKKANAMRVEAQAFDLMDLPDHRIEATLDRLGGGFLADDMGGEFLPDDLGLDGFGLDDGLDDLGLDDGLDGFGLDDGLDDLGLDDGLAPSGDMYASLRAEIDGLKASIEGMRSASKPVVSAEDAMLAEMLADESKTAGDEPEDDEAEAEVAAKKAGDEPEEEEEDEPEDEVAAAKKAYIAAAKRAGEEVEDDEVEDEAVAAKKAFAAAKKAYLAAKAKQAGAGADPEDEEDDEGGDKAAGTFSMTSDPMGLNDVTASDDDTLADLFRNAGDEAEDAEEDDGDKTAHILFGADEGEDEEDAQAASKKASRTASRRQLANVVAPRQGVKALGQVRMASTTGGREVQELSKLWESKPDVSDVF